MSGRGNARLGRGLAALLGEAARPDPAVENTVRMLPIESLRPGPFQARMIMSEELLESLAASIRSSGILQPILVRPEPDEPDAYQIIAGERRWRAAQRVGLHTIPCLVRAFSNAEAMAAGLVENLQRQDLNAIEEAEGYRRLTGDFGQTQEDVATSVGKSRSHVSNMMRLLSLPLAVQQEVRNGALSAGHARALLAHDDPQRAALAVVARGLNVRQTEALVRQAIQPRSHRTMADRLEITAVEQQLQEHLGLTVKIKFDGQGGDITLRYSSLDQMEMLIALLKNTK